MQHVRTRQLIRPWVSGSFLWGAVEKLGTCFENQIVCSVENSCEFTFNKYPSQSASSCEPHGHLAGEIFVGCSPVHTELVAEGDAHQRVLYLNYSSSTGGSSKAGGTASLPSSAPVRGRPVA